VRPVQAALVSPRAEPVRPAINNKYLACLRGSGLPVVFGLWIADSVVLVPASGPPKWSVEA
jgi:hypothetical protein